MTRAKRENVMLAYPVDSGRINRLGASFAVQPKYKGERCRVEWFHGSPILLSSFGNEFRYLNHITESLKKLKEFPFDGEIYKHGWSQGRINSAANRKKNKNPDSVLLEYHIFDLQFPSVLQKDRLIALNKIDMLMHELRKKEKNFPLFISPQHLVIKKEWLGFATYYIELGYEGLILRHLEKNYTFKRNTGLLKFKPTETDEYLITDVLRAISIDGRPKDMVGAFMVRAPDEDVSFKVGAGKIKHTERERLWQVRSFLIGKTLEVKQELTKTSKGIPDCAVAVRVL